MKKTSVRHAKNVKRDWRISTSDLTKFAQIAKKMNLFSNCKLEPGTNIFLWFKTRINYLFNYTLHSLCRSHSPVQNLFIHDCYGNTVCGVFKRGVQNWKDFCIRINIPKGNYWILSFEFWINGKLSKIGHHFSNKVI